MTSRSPHPSSSAGDAGLPRAGEQLTAVRKLLRTAALLTSAENASHFPPDSGRELAFAGRSNAGKSSAINTVCGRRNLARTSRTPGRTRLLNFFSLGGNADLRLVDLPGYGYARVPLKQRSQWGQVLSDYVSQRKSLGGIVLVMDIRHPLRDSDLQLLDFATHCKIGVHILLTRADKLSRMRGGQTLQQAVQNLDGSFSVQTFSSLKKTGVDCAVAHIARLLQYSVTTD